MTDVFDEMDEDISDDSDLSESALFTPAIGDPVSCKVGLDIRTDLQPGGLEAQVWGSETTIEYLLSEVGREANEGETFTVPPVGGTVYTVQYTEENDGIFVKVAVK